MSIQTQVPQTQVTIEEIVNKVYEKLKEQLKQMLDDDKLLFDTIALLAKYYDPNNPDTITSVATYVTNTIFNAERWLEREETDIKKRLVDVVNWYYAKGYDENDMTVEWRLVYLYFPRLEAHIHVINGASQYLGEIQGTIDTRELDKASYLRYTNLLQKVKKITQTIFNIMKNK